MALFLSPMNIFSLLKALSHKWGGCGGYMTEGVMMSAICGTVSFSN